MDNFQAESILFSKGKFENFFSLDMVPPNNDQKQRGGFNC